MGLGEGFFRPSIFEKFHFFYRKRPIFRLGGHMAPPPWLIGLSLILGRNNPINHGLFEGFFVLTRTYEDDIQKQAT